MKNNIHDKDFTRKILHTIRECMNNDTSSSLITDDKLLKEENDGNEKSNKFRITKTTKQFGDVRESQEDALLKTIGESIEINDDGLVYYPDRKDLVLTAKINSLNLVFQFKYNDPSGDGCYIWANGLQLTDTNNRTLGKVRDAFVNWKSNLIENGDLLEKLDKASKENR